VLSLEAPSSYIFIYRPDLSAFDSGDRHHRHYPKPVRSTDDYKAAPGGVARLNESHDSVNCAAWFPLKKEMRPLKRDHSHLGFDPPKFFETRRIDETILLCPDVQDRHGDSIRISAYVTCEHSPEARGQYLRLHRGDRSPHRRQQRRRRIRPNEPTLGCKTWHRDAEYERREQ
jgi:hypothetical protein